MRWKQKYSWLFCLNAARPLSIGWRCCRKRQTISLAAMVILLVGMSAGELPAETDAVIDFQSLEMVDAENHLWGNEYEEDGFRLFNPGSNGFATWGTLSGGYPGSTALYNNDIDGTTELTHVTGPTWTDPDRRTTPFNLKSIDISNLLHVGPVTVNFVGYLDGGGTVNASYTTTGSANVLETFVFPNTFRGLLAVHWVQEEPFHQFDNIRVSTVDTIMDFQSLEIQNYFENYWPNVQNEDGFKVETNNLFSSYGTYHWFYPGSTALYAWGSEGPVVTLKNLTNQPFDLLSIDIAKKSYAPVSVTFTGTLHCGGGTVTATFATDATLYEPKLWTFVLPDTFRGLASVEWTEEYPYHQFDNIRVYQSDTIVDFQSLEVVGDSFSTWGDSYEEDGYELTTPDGNGFGTWETMSFGYAGSTALFNNLVDGQTVLTGENGGPFNLISIDIANFFNAGPVTVDFVGTKDGGGSVNASYTTTGSTNVLETFFLPDTFTNLESVQWLQEDPFHQFDNIRVSQDDTYVDFQLLEIDDGNTHLWDDVYEEDEFRLINLSGTEFHTCGIQEPRYPGSTALFNSAGELTRLESSSGEPFDLFSMDIANLNNDGPVTVSFTGFVDSGGTVNGSYTTSGSANVLETFVFPDSFRRLTAVDWVQESPFHQFDNIRVSISDIFVPANSYTEFRGILVSGDLASTTQSDDEYLRYNPGLVLTSEEAPVWLIFDGNLPTCDTLELHVEAQAGTPGLTTTLEAWNWNTSSYDVVDVSATSFNSDTVTTVDLMDGIGDYVETGSRAVRARIGWRKTGLAINFPWEVRLDQLVWIVQ